MNTTIQTFNFNGLPVAVIDHNQEAWMTGEDVGKALEYSTPRDSIKSIFVRNRDELEEFSVKVKLTSTDGKLYDTRVYNEEGVMLISMFSNQPKAKAFRRWAVQVLKQHRLSAQHTVVATLDLARENGHLKDMVHARDEIIALKDGAIMGLQSQLIGSQVHQIRLLGKVASMQKRQNDLEVIQRIERMEAEGKSRAEIIAATGRNSNYIRQRIYIAKQEGRLS